MIHTVLRVSVFFDGDLVTVGKVFANNSEEVARIIGFGTFVKTQIKVEGQLAGYFEVPVEVEECGNGTKVRTTVLVMENIPHHIRSSDLPQITDSNTFRLAYKESLRIN